MRLFPAKPNGKKPRSPRAGGGRGGGGRAGGGGKGGGSGGSGGFRSSGGSSGKGYVRLNNDGSRSASVYGKGGGSPVTLSSGSFAGRTSGGGTRGQVAGSQRYGSGYPYGGTTAWVSGRPFPFGFWPIVFTPYNYYGSHNYGHHNNTERPGGVMTQAEISHSSWPTRRKRQDGTANSNATMPYYILADEDSVTAVLQQLVEQCGAKSVTAAALNPDDPSSVQPQQMVQYYRASSFALALQGYNDTANNAAYAPPTEDWVYDNATASMVDTPLPNGTDANFLNCVNSTIAASVPIMDDTDYNAGARTIHGISHIHVGLLTLLFVLYSILGDFFGF